MKHKNVPYQEIPEDGIYKGIFERNEKQVEVGFFKPSELEHLLLDARFDLQADKEYCDMCKVLYSKVNQILDYLQPTRTAIHRKTEEMMPNEM